MKTCTILTLAVLLAGSARISAAPIPTAPIHTNKTRFRIPFHYKPAELASLGAREIRLYVSRDNGVTWKQVQAVAPDAGKFNFQASGDGEYWFIVRTLDSRNHLHPDGNVTDPGLMVIVDTAQPRLDLKLQQTVPGKVQLAWSASDEHLDISQLRLEYLQPGALEWQPVSVVPKANGQTSWSVPQGGIVAVRGSIADQAKNTTEVQAQARIAPANQAVPRPGAPDRREPVAGPTTTPRDDLALTLPDRFPSTGAEADRGEGERASLASQGPAGQGQLPRSASEPQITPKNSFVSLKSGDAPTAGGPPARVSARQRVVASRKFQIGYKLQDLGPSGVDRVELYITQDNGDTWFHYGADDDNQSPFQVEVPREGTYGFTLGVRSGSGLASEPPRNGDPPAIVVVVDQTRPALELVSVEQGRGTDRNKLFISWKCSDDNLTERPISLSCATGAQGPWRPIAGPIENSGSFAWTMGKGAPTRLYVRIEARDQAGNTETVDLPKPVLIDASRPTAQIIDIESPVAPLTPRE